MKWAQMGIAFLAGLLIGALSLAIVTKLGDSDSVKDHWQRIEQFQQFRRNPSNYESDSRSGLSSATVPIDPLPSLAALVSAGELAHEDLVFPNVESNDRTNRYWMQFVESHPGIVETLASSPSKLIKSGGKPLLHLNVWFKPDARNDVLELVQGIEALTAENDAAE